MHSLGRGPLIWLKEHDEVPLQVLGVFWKPHRAGPRIKLGARMARFSGRDFAVARIAASLFVAALLFSIPRAAHAVPSYARQTGLACEACHTVFPQLTPFGRSFKASGYTLFNTNKVSDIESS